MAGALKHPVRLGLFLGITALVALLLVCGAGSDRAGAAFPGQPGKIVFDRYLRGSGPTERKAIYVIKPNGNGLRMLTKGCQPNFSADGKRIVFARRGKNGVQSIYKMKADGTKVRRLTATKTLDRMPAWSPDGRHIVFSRGRFGKTPYVDPMKPSHIYKMKANGKRVKNLTPRSEGDVPDWSPTGKRIAYASLTSPKGTVTMRPNGKGKRALGGGEPDWSPTGRQIAFDAFDRKGHEGEIWVMNANGEHARAIGPGGDLDGVNAAWSPDGRKIAFVGFHPPGGTEEGFIGLFTMDADGTNVEQLTVGGKTGDFGLNDSFPDWQPR